MADIVVVARAEAKSGSEAAAERAFLDVVAPTHEENGCIRYALHRGADDPKTLVMIERWSSRDALDAHLRSAHVARLFDALGPLLTGPAEILVLEALSDHIGTKGTIA